MVICKSLFQSFKNVLLQFSEKYEFSMEVIKESIYEEVISGKWWNLNSFFEKFQQDHDQSNEFLKSFVKTRDNASLGKLKAFHSVKAELWKLACYHI